MKNIWKLIIGLSIFAVYSCEMNVFFKEAMPPDIAAINSIPSPFQGIFLCEDDSTLIHVEDKVIFQESYFQFILKVTDIKDREDCFIVAGGLYVPWKEECIPFEYLDEETILGKVHEIDTLYSFKSNEVAKFYKGRLFLNVKSGSDWMTSMIKPQSDGAMDWKIIEVPDELDLVEAITPNYTTRINREEETQYILQPTLVEFDRILEREYTRSCYTFKPINYEL